MGRIRAARTGIADRANLGRLLVIAFMLLAFSLQSYVAQTHFHQAVFGQSASAQALGDAPAKPANLPVNDDSMNCPLCKEILQSAHFVGTAWLVLAAPIQTSLPLQKVVIHRPRLEVAAFPWRSRAPPRH